MASSTDFEARLPGGVFGRRYVPQGYCCTKTCEDVDLLPATTCLAPILRIDHIRLPYFFRHLGPHVNPLAWCTLDAVGP